MTAGFVLSGRIWEFADRTDEVGGAIPSGSIIYEGVEMRLQNAPNSLLMNIQGYETSKFFSATVHPRPGMNLVEGKHYFEPIFPPNYRYVNKMFRIVSIQEPNFHPADPRRYFVVNLDRSDTPHSEDWYSPAEDTTSPTVVITSSESSPSFAATIPITITFSESVTGFVVGDIDVSGCTLSNFAGSGAVYTVTATPNNNTVTIDVPAGVCIDSEGNENTTAAQFSMTSLAINLATKWDFSTADGLYQGSDTSSPVTADGQTIGYATDESGNTRHFLQPASGNRPLWKSNIKNGLGVARFDGIDDYLRATYTLNQPVTTYMVVYIDNYATNDTIIDGVADQCKLYMNSTTQITLMAGNFVATSSKFAQDTWGILRIVWNGASSGWYLNDGSIDSGNAGANNPGGTTLAANFAASAAADIDVGEVLNFSAALSVSVDTAVRNYLNSKWAVY